jgi:hypothetical protein
MLQKGMLTRIGGGLALICLMFLPLGGCFNKTFSGSDLLSHSSVPGGVKLLLIISILSAFCAFFLNAAIQCFISGGVGMTGLIGVYTLLSQKYPDVELKIGGYLAMIGFGLILVEGFILQKKEPGEQQESG